MVARRNLGLAASAVVLAGVGGTLVRPAAAAQPATLLEVLKVSRDLSKFAALVKEAGLEGELAKPGSFGLFAPHDPYFNSLNAPTMAALTGNKERLRRLVANHVTTRAVTVFPGGTTAGTEAGGDVTLLQTLAGTSVALWNGAAGLPRIEGRVIWVANLTTGNGVAHCIDGLIGGWTA
jgi:uncharacterized surface protein with fasciclin (FAS1) repeats